MHPPLLSNLRHPTAPISQFCALVSQATTLAQLDGESPASQRSPIPTKAVALAKLLAEVDAEVVGLPPFETFGEVLGEDKQAPVLDQVRTPTHSRPLFAEPLNNCATRLAAATCGD